MLVFGVLKGTVQMKAVLGVLTTCFVLEIRKNIFLSSNVGLVMDKYYLSCFSDVYKIIPTPM